MSDLKTRVTSGLLLAGIIAAAVFCVRWMYVAAYVPNYSMRELLRLTLLLDSFDQPSNTPKPPPDKPSPTPYENRPSTPPNDFSQLIPPNVSTPPAAPQPHQPPAIVPRPPASKNTYKQREQAVTIKVTPPLGDEFDESIKAYLWPLLKMSTRLSGKRIYAKVFPSFTVRSESSYGARVGTLNLTLNLQESDTGEPLLNVASSGMSDVDFHSNPDEMKRIALARALEGLKERLHSHEN